MTDLHKEALVQRFDVVLKQIQEGGDARGDWKTTDPPYTPEVLLLEVAVEKLVGAIGASKALEALGRAKQEVRNSNLKGR